MPETTTYAKALNRALFEELDRDPDVFLMGEDIGAYGGVFRVTEGLQARFGEDRVRDTPISESAFVGCALGAAMMGKRPVVEIMFVDFTTVAMDPIVNQIAKMRYMSGGRVRVPLVIRTQGGGYRGQGAQHAQSLEAFFLHVPGLYVAMPSDASDAYNMLRAAIRNDNPVIFIEHKLLYNEPGPIREDDEPVGRAKVAREGRDVTLVTYSYATRLARQAAETLAAEGIEAEIVDLRWLNPLDFATVAASVRKTHRAVVVHEAHARCGVGADLSGRIARELFDDLDGPVGLVTAADVPIPHASTLESRALPGAEAIADAVRRFF